MPDLIMSHPYPERGWNTDDRVTVDDGEALHLIRSGVAVPATARDAGSLGEDPSTSATARKKEAASG